MDVTVGWKLIKTELHVMWVDRKLAIDNNEGPI